MPLGSAPTGSAGAPAKDAAFVAAFDDLLKEHLSPVIEKSKACGPDVEKIAQEFHNAFLAQRQMLVVASKCKKPTDETVFQKILQPTSDLMSKVEGLRDRRSKQFNHLSMVAEGVTCLQWVCIDRTPASALSDIMPGSEMYGNKVVMEFKGKDEAQVSFAKDFKLFLVELQKYVKAHHTTGLSWNANGGQDYFSASAAPAPPKAAPGGPPPPPPPPPPGFFDEKPKAQTSAPGGGAAALFAELNAKGETGVTAGLKKVSKDQMTHKNPALRASSVVTAAEKSAAKTTVAAAAPAKKPPRMEQQGAKWFIEHFDGNRDLKITECNVKTAVCLVQCKASLLQVPGKINTLQIDGCVKTSVVVESCVASVDIINCKSCEIQITGSTPMVTMDGCAGVMVYLSPQCVADDTSIVSSKCSEINIVLPAKSEDSDPVELPVPEQFETKIRDGKLVTTAISHAGCRPRPRVRAGARHTAAFLAAAFLSTSRPRSVGRVRAGCD